MNECNCFSSQQWARTTRGMEWITKINKCKYCIEKELYEKAEKIALKDYQEDYLYDPNIEVYFPSIRELKDYYKDVNRELPKYIWGCYKLYLNLNMRDIVENELVDNHYENAFSEIREKSLNDLQCIVDLWTKAQNLVSYHQDTNIVVLLEETQELNEYPYSLRDIALSLKFQGASGLLNIMQFNKVLHKKGKLIVPYSSYNFIIPNYAKYNSKGTLDWNEEGKKWITEKSKQWISWYNTYMMQS